MQKRLAVGVISIISTLQSLATSYTDGGEGILTCAWEKDDRIAVTTGVSNYGTTTQLCFWATATDNGNPAMSSFYATGYNLKGGTQYHAYSPYRWQADFNAEALTFAYTGQRQTADGATAHLAAYDYRTATTTADAQTAFLMLPLSTVLKITFTPQAEEEEITIHGAATEVTTNLITNITTPNNDNDITLLISGATPGEPYTAYAAIPTAAIKGSVTITIGDTTHTIEIDTERRSDGNIPQTTYAVSAYLPQITMTETTIPDRPSAIENIEITKEKGENTKDKRQKENTYILSTNIAIINGKKTLLQK